MEKEDVIGIPSFVAAEFNMQKRRFAREETSSNCGYPAGFCIKHVLHQVAIFKKLSFFKHLEDGFVEEVAAGIGSLPRGVEGLVVVPKPTVVAKTNYDAFLFMMNVMSKVFTDKWEELLWPAYTPDFIRLTHKTRYALEKLEAETPGDFLVFPAQLGLLHRGKSARRARICMEDNEFGLDPYSAGMILLAHPERLVSEEDLGIDCVGCEWINEMPTGDFIDHLRFSYEPTDEEHEGGIKLGAEWSEEGLESCGPASGFVVPGPL